MSEYFNVHNQNWIDKYHLNPNMIYPSLYQLFNIFSTSLFLSRTTQMLFFHLWEILKWVFTLNFILSLFIQLFIILWTHFKGYDMFFIHICSTMSNILVSLWIMSVMFFNTNIHKLAGFSFIFSTTNLKYYALRFVFFIIFFHKEIQLL